jgi:uncharacterized protein
VNNLFEQIKDFAKSMMSDDFSHGFDHVERVVKFCWQIGNDEGADIEILIPAAYLHDIGRKFEEKDPKLDHAVEGAKIARDFLIKIGYPKYHEVSYAISVHRFSGGFIPKTLEAKILQDADRLDALGAIGIYRTIMYSTKNHRNIEDTIEHFEKKILTLKDTMQTPTAKRLALEKHKIVEEFVSSLKEALFVR